MNTDIAIKVQNLSKVYKLYDKPIDRLKESINPFSRKYHKEFYALNEVSFDIRKGETIGIIGKNGSGKSTLLKIITGVLTPTSGTVQVDGKVSALLELGAGFNPELTGIENVYLHGMIMGYSKKDMDEKLDSILSFADIGEFIYQPVKAYSSGMFVRLAFAVAISVDPEVLIIDEALSVGDGRFQIKCFERIKGLQESGKTILFVSHDLQSIRQFCDIAFLFDKGILLEAGIPNEVVNHYTRLLFMSEDFRAKELLKKQKEKEIDVDSGGTNEYRYGTQGGLIEYVDVLDNNFNSVRALTSCDEVVLRMEVTAQKRIQKPIYAMTVKTTKGLEIYGTNSYYQGLTFEPLNPGDKFEITFRQHFNLIPGNYFISFGFVELVDNDIVPLDRRYDTLEIKVLPEGRDRSFGLANLVSKITVRPISQV